MYKHSHMISQECNIKEQTFDVVITPTFASENGNLEATNKFDSLTWCQKATLPKKQNATLKLFRLLNVLT